MTYTLEKVQAWELDTCMGIIDAGKAFQREQGFTQWTDDYPNRDTLRGDIRDGTGYVLKADGRVAGYMCIDFGGEPAYDKIDGQWASDEPYAVVHRLAFDAAYRGKGLADTTFRLIEELCLAKDIHCIRVDTDFPNKRMQHVLTKNGFVNRGVIIFQGSRKLAYDKSL